MTLDFAAQRSSLTRSTPDSGSHFASSTESSDDGPRVLEDVDASEHVRVYQAGLRAAKNLKSKKSQYTAEQRARARKKIAAGEQAASRLVESMLKLSTRIVREIAETRHGREGAAPMLEDLISEAHLAVLEAAKSFDPTKDVGFSRWAAQQVRNTIRTHVMEDNDSGFKIYSSWSRVRRRAIPERHDLAMKLGRNPNMVELKKHMVAVCMDWAFDHLRPEEQELPLTKRQEAAMAKLRKQGTLSAIENLEDALNSGAHPVRLDTPVNDDEDGGSWANFLPSEGEDTKAHDRLALQELRDLLLKAISPLTERERTIVLYRFGFVDGEVWTYRSIGDMFGISAERVRQIEESVRNYLSTESEYAVQLSAHLRDW